MPDHPRNLHRHECLGFSHSTLKTKWTFRGLDGEPVSVPIVSKFMVNQSEPLLTACLVDMGFILQPLELVREALRDDTLVEVLPEFPCISPSISVFYLRDRSVTPKLRSFLDFCAEEFSEQVLTAR